MMVFMILYYQIVYILFLFSGIDSCALFSESALRLKLDREPITGAMVSVFYAKTINKHGNNQGVVARYTYSAGFFRLKKLKISHHKTPFFSVLKKILLFPIPRGIKKSNGCMLQKKGNCAFVINIFHEQILLPQIMFRGFRPF